MPQIEDLTAIRQAIEAIQGQGLTPQEIDLEFVFSATAREVIQPLGKIGLLQNLLLEIPNLSTAASVIATIKNVKGKIVWQSGTLLKNASYRDQDAIMAWVNQVLVGGEILVLTGNDVAGAGGGTARAYGRVWGTAI